MPHAKKQSTSYLTSFVPVTEKTVYTVKEKPFRCTEIDNLQPKQ